MKDELISKNSLIANLKYFAPEHFKPLIQHLIRIEHPVDAVIPVRCGECIHRHDPRRFSCQGRPKDWYCADGVRRNNHD